MTFENAISGFDEYLNAHGRAGKTIYGYLRDVRRFHALMEHIHNRPLELEEVEGKDIELFVSFLYHQKKLQPRSINRILHALTSFYSFAKTYEFVEINPMIRIPRLTYEKKQRLFMTDEQLKEFLTGIDDALQRVVFFTLAYTGVRVSELTNLQVRDVDLVEGTISVPGKGRKNRTIPIHPALKQQLSKYADKELVSCSDHDLFFHTHGTTSLSPSTVNRWIKVRTASLGWNKPITAHTFRHTFAFMFIEHGGHVVELQHLLGHESLLVTSVYSHTSVHRLTLGVDRLPSM